MPENYVQVGGITVRVMTLYQKSYLTMKYYLIKCTSHLPDGFGGIAQGPLIKLLRKYQNDVGLIEHEKSHVRQWYAVMTLGLLFWVVMVVQVSPAFWVGCGISPFLHQLLYRFARPYRRWSEVKAYRTQIATGDYRNNEFAVIALVEKYDLDLSVDEAKALIFS